MAGRFDWLLKLDRRYIFVLMTIAVMWPVVQPGWFIFPETPSGIVNNAFDTIESLPDGSRVFMAFDYDPGSQPELDPMAVALTWHCAKKGHKMFFVALWPFGAQKIDWAVGQVIEKDFPNLVYGEDYVILGYQVGAEGLIRRLVQSIQAPFPNCARGNSLSAMPVSRDVQSLADFDLIVSVSAGAPGTKEWIQYAATPLNLKVVGACTGVQAPQLYPYYPAQMQGLLGAIKGAAEYEAALADHYEEFGRLTAAKGEDGEERLDPRYSKGRKRMGPQLMAHCLILALIVLGNVIHFLQRRPRRAS